jgi:hypothetical protein
MLCSVRILAVNLFLGGEFSINLVSVQNAGILQYRYCCVPVVLKELRC